MTDTSPGAPPHVRFEHVPHPHFAERHRRGPAKVADQAAPSLNGRIALLICAGVGSMVCAYIFAAIALVSLPAALSTGQLIVIVAWLAQTFIQLVLLPIIIVGQNIQGKAADQRAADTYADAETILHECLQLQAHLEAQDKVLDHLVARLAKIG